MQNGMNRENVYEFESVEEAIEKVKDEENQGDIILVKASNGMNFKKIVEEIANYPILTINCINKYVKFSNLLVQDKFCTACNKNL